MENSFELKKNYLWNFFKFRPHIFMMYWEFPPMFPKVFLGKASFRFKNDVDSNDSQLRIWTFDFIDTTPGYIMKKIRDFSVTNEGCITPMDALPCLKFEPVYDFYEQIFSRISPGNDETDRGMKSFYKNVYSRIEDPEFKKYIFETIKEWSKPEYVLSEQCQYILKEIEEKDGKPNENQL